MNDIGVLPNFLGTGVHDGWASYQEYDFTHGLCNSHHLRELTYIGEQLGEGWALKMKRYLMKVNPMTYGLAALRRVLEPVVPAGTPSLELSLAVTAVCGILLLLASARVANSRSARDTTV